ncbi:MAG TPA: WecB/TagA/CpsF family glycosyltransferase [Candidatus Bathyarchaeia archaeon]|nr:WecB/TagA/CpsF family glycosyltransferase [Candidatus Bathyarchaeia archaeon]
MDKKHLSFDKILGFEIVSSLQERLLDFVRSQVREGQHLFIVTLNPEFVIASKNDADFLKTIHKADLVIPDGVGLVWAGEVLKERGVLRKILKGFRVGMAVLSGNHKRQVIAGVELMESLCRLAAKNGWSVYLLGAGPGIAQKTLAVLKVRYPGLRGWAAHGPKLKRQNSKFKTQNCWIKDINQKKPNFLFVALGMKKQEQFIRQNWSVLKVNLAIGVGGAFDQIATPSLKPPGGLQRIGLGWLYRLLRQPRRWRRQLTLLKFIWLVLREDE